jgi:hypothetical protein
MKRVLFAGVVVAVLVYAAETPARNDVQLRAMSDELARSKTLQLNNLDKPGKIPAGATRGPRR